MYNVERTDLSKPSILVDMSKVKVQGGLRWVGQYHSRWGELLQENTLRLVENFASPNPPYHNDDVNGVTFNKIEGMLWFDTDDEEHLGRKILKIQNGRSTNTDGWKRIEVIISDTEPANHTSGEIWYDTRDLTFSVSRSTRWENLTVKKALDSDLLDGLDSTQFLRSDIDDVALGTLQMSLTYPRTTRTYDLGRVTNMWMNIFGQNLVAETSHNMIPRIHNEYDLGLETQRWRTANFVLMRTESTLDLLPLNTDTYGLGSSFSRWRNLHVRHANVEFLSTVKPFDANSDLGSTESRWPNLYASHIDVSSSKSLIPQTASLYDLGTLSTRWKNLHVDFISNTTTGHLRPATSNLSDLGSASQIYRGAYINNLYGNLKFGNDINFDIVRNANSKGISWTGVTDQHRIYVEETANNQTTNLVIQNADDENDTTVFRHRISRGTPVTTLQVSRNVITVTAGNLKNRGTVEIENPAQANRGCRQFYNNVTHTLEFRFY